MAISLPDFISRTGEPESAELFGVKERTVQSWRRRERYPRANQAQRIVDACAGEVDYAGIYGPDADAGPLPASAPQRVAEEVEASPSAPQPDQAAA